MMELEENKRKAWHKILDADGRPIDGSKEHWPLPTGRGKGGVACLGHTPALWLKEGQWLPVHPNAKGTWLVADPKGAYSPNSGQRVYVAEALSPPLWESPGIVWVAKARLAREATYRELKRHGIFKAFAQNAHRP